MSKEKKHYTSYQAMPSRSRFWIHSESCYTEAELGLRSWALKARANSGIHADYLASPSSWFAEDGQALINIYDNSWFFSNAYRTRHVLTRDDFLVQPVDNHRLQWPQLYDLMQKTGDYLLLRNQNLPQDHLNQPMNFILLDVNNILKGISQNPNIAQTQEQLMFLMRYVRNIEKNTSPLIGSDRMFLATFRNNIDVEILPQLTQMIDSQLLKDRLGDLSKIINQLSSERNRVLHFSLNSNAVNPHPHDFSSATPDTLNAYPTQAAKACAKSDRIIVPNFKPVLKLSAKNLQSCPGFELVTMDENTLEHYAKAVSELGELDQFQNIINGIIELLGQAGEVYTVYQFKEQLILLFEQIDHFIDRSSDSMEAIIHLNNEAYHKAIHEEQNLSLLKKWFTSEKERLNTFIQNQDVLAQFPSTTTDLFQTNQALKKGVSQIMGHLNESPMKKTNFAAVAEQAQKLNTLMDSMYHWTKSQHEINGLEAPKIPEKLSFLPETQLHSFNSVLPILSGAPCTNGVSIHSEQMVCAPDFNTRSLNSNVHFYIALFSLIPIGIIAFYFLFKSQDKPEEVILGEKQEFDELKVKLDDLLTQLRVAQESNNSGEQMDYEVFIERYQDINKKADSGRYEIGGLNELYADISFFYKEYFPSGIRPSF